MKKNRSGGSEITIDETAHEEVPGIIQRLKDAVSAVIFGILLVQIIFFWGAFRTGSFGLGISVVLLYDNIFFLGWLVFCAVMGWFAGSNFIGWLRTKFDNWKFW